MPLVGNGVESGATGGTTGVQMLLDAAKQVRGTTGEYQIDGANTIGGSATADCFIVGHVFK